MSDTANDLQDEHLDRMLVLAKEKFAERKPMLAAPLDVEDMINEIRRRRATDLSGAELSELSNARACIKSVLPSHCAGMVAVIDRILRAHGVPK